MTSGTDDYRTEKERREEMMDIHHGMMSDTEGMKDAIQEAIQDAIRSEEKYPSSQTVDPTMAPPSHYAFGVYEVFKVASAWGFWQCAAKFSALKYLARAGKKDGESEIKDLEKAIHYLKVRVQHLKEEGNK